MNKKEVVDCETQETAPRYMSVGNIFIRSNVPNVTMISHDIIRLRWINGGSAELARVTIMANTPALDGRRYTIAIIITAASCRRDRNFRPLISDGSPRLFPYFPRPQQRGLRSVSACVRRESSRKRRSQRFLRRTIVPHPSLPCRRVICAVRSAV